MNPNESRIVVIGGPNGAGKTTAAPLLLRGALGVTEFVNADVIARGLSAFRPEDVAIDAGRLMLERLHALAHRQTSFAFETTLASRSVAPRLTGLRRHGYTVHVVFLWLPSADLSVARVLERVRRGGHDVPEETVRRRYRTGLRNFFSLYRQVATSWRLYDNSERDGYRLVAVGAGADTRRVISPKLWRAIEEDAARE